MFLNIYLSVYPIPITNVKFKANIANFCNTIDSKVL
jgi:hypothetical protein